MATPKISTITSLGKVISEGNDIETNLYTKPVPSGSTNYTVQANIQGKTRTISIDGEFIGTETQIKAFITEVEAWMNSSGLLQFQSNRTYTDSFGTEYSVLCSRFNWNRENITIGFINYTIEMREGRTITTIVLGTPTDET